METHYHFNAITAVAIFALIVAAFGTIHLLALTQDNRASRAWVSLGF